MLSKCHWDTLLGVYMMILCMSLSPTTLTNLKMYKKNGVRHE